MTDTTTSPPQEPEIKEEVTLESLEHRLDMLGEQMNWLCENLAGVFGFVNQMGQNGGGVRGMLKAMKEMPGLGAELTPGDEQ